MTTEDTPAEVDVTVITVTYESASQIADCLESAVGAADAAGLSAELIVVDNASMDGTADVVADAVPDAVVVRNSTNVGFGTANNQAFADANGRWWLLLNPDARLDERALGVLVRELDADSGLAAVGPTIAGAGTGGAESAGMLPGIRSFAGHFLFVNRLLSRDRGGPWRGWMVRHHSARTPRPVEWVSGAVTLLRPQAVREVGGFDESIFLYGEDTDLCARLADRGWRVALVPAAKAWHTIGGSQEVTSTRWVDGLEHFMIKRGVSRLRRSVCFALMTIGLGLRSLPERSGSLQRRRGDVLRMRAGASRAMTLTISTLGRRRYVGQSDPYE